MQKVVYIAILHVSTLHGAFCCKAFKYNLCILHTCSHVCMLAQLLLHVYLPEFALAPKSTVHAMQQYYENILLDRPQQCCVLCALM